MKNLEKWIPCIFTFANLSLGFIAMTFMIAGYFRTSLTLIILALFFDGIDGRLSRKYNVSSIIGKELDSLSDYLSFGVAPSLLYISVQSPVNFWHYVFVLYFLLFGAYQIAKYNTDFLYGSSEYVLLGLPINATGIILATMGYLAWFPLGLEIAIILIMSPLMVIQTPYPSFKAHHPKKLVHILIPIVAMLVFVIFPGVALVVFMLYVIYGVASNFVDFGELKKIIDNV